MNIIQKLTEAQWFTSIMNFLGAEGVPIETWVGKRHPGLAFAKYLGRALGAFDGFATALENSLFLQTATGLGLKKFARSQYQLEPFPAQPQVARFTLRSSFGSPDTTAASGDVVVGLVGGDLEWTGSAFSLRGGRRAVVLFTATGAGPEWNIPVNSRLELRTTLVGVTVSNDPVGPATPVGSGAAGLYMFAAVEGATVVIVDPGVPSQLLSVAGNILTKVVTISLGTDGGGSLTTTAAQLEDELTDIIANGGFAVDAILAACVVSGAGTGIVQPTGSPAQLDWTGSYIDTPGAYEESEESLKARCLTRFMALGGWAGDGAPPAPVSTDEALEFWARAPTGTARRSPVVGVKILSNFLNGAPSGKDITVIVWGALGALSNAELAAVDSNFYNGRKFSVGSDLHTITVTNVAVQLLGSVDVRLSAGLTEDEVRAAIAARLALYQQNTRAVYPGCTLRPVILGARIADALADQVIDDVTLTLPAADTTYTYLEYPQLDPSQLSINFVT